MSALSKMFSVFTLGMRPVACVEACIVVCLYNLLPVWYTYVVCVDLFGDV
jgi:hypothetical protein